MNDQNKSFRLTSDQPSNSNKKWWQFRKMGKKEYGRTFWVCILLVVIFRGGVISSGFFVGALVCGLMWITNIIRDKRSKKSE